MAFWIFLVFMVSLIFAIPITMSMVLGALTPLILGGTGSSIQQLIANSFSGSDTTPILAVPLFILGGVLMAEGGISRRLFNFFAYFVGNLPGGLPCAVILTCLFYGAISGSGPATTAAVGSMTIPFLVEMGYSKTWSAGMIATAGGLGVIIPPSIPFVLYSLATGVSTGALFLGGILPGILIGLAMMVYAVIYCIRNGEDKEKINIKMSELRAKGFLSLLKESFWALMSPIIVLGGIYSGIVTPTEAAVISVFYSLFVSLVIYKSFTVKSIVPFLGKAVKTYAPLCFVLAFAIAFGRVLALAKAPALIENFILSNFTSSFTVLTGIVVVFLILGMVMDTGPAIVILSPILLPAVQAMGVHPVHFGVIMVCCLSIGLATPPFGLDLFVAGTLADTAPMNVAKTAIPFILAFAIALFLITYIPWFSLVFL
ncbi:TRAP transporter large permease [Anoxynatronum buryatiense]|uniref:C4-dicarboxylate transporter, DctM subunit n=1 Tax=Anoxynatronum buryatiense TaxID=489973 RepID=A0AA45WUW8_9CLOT|nr:C4-dicarboxylate transporter, DctM subunit [Anoxynatronum buryatiense]